MSTHFCQVTFALPSEGGMVFIMATIATTTINRLNSSAAIAAPRKARLSLFNDL